MVHGEDAKKDAPPGEGPDEAKWKTIVIGKLKTDEEANLAAEFEKLLGQEPRGASSKKDHDNDA